MLRSLISCLLLSLSGCGGDDPKRDSGLPPLPPKVSEEALPAGEVRPVRELAIALVGEVRGELEPCGCPTVPYGGFERRQNYLEQLRAVPRPLFHLDAGEALVRGLSTWNREDAGERASLILGLMAAVGVDAYAPGPSDLVALGEDWRALLGGSGLRVISATWRDPVSGAAVFPASAVIERGGVKLGVIGLSGRPEDADSRGAVQWVDPLRASREAIAALPADLDLVVGLSNLPDREALRVAEGAEGLAALLSVRSGRYDPPKQTAGAPVIETPDRGRYITEINLYLGAPAGRPLLLDEGASASLLELLRLRRRIQLLESAGSAVLEESRRRLGALEAEVATLARGRNLVALEDTPLGREMAGEAPVSERLAAFKGVQLDRAAAGAAAITPETPGYVTAAACSSCHTRQVAHWAYTSHVDAMQALLDRGAEEDPECLPCHSTGFGEPGGFADPSDRTQRARFKGVQCESCHGPLSKHPATVRTPPPVTEARCLGCHDEANSPEFDYSSYLRKVQCPSSG